MKKVSNINSGERFGRLTVVNDINARHVECKCDCGSSMVAIRGNLKCGKTTSCGCIRKERNNNTQHGASKTLTFKRWMTMRRRCSDVNIPQFKDYGGRGISVCERWNSSFVNFLEDMGECPSGKYTLDRINNDGNYEPSNCRWATAIQQARNSSLARLLEFRGESLSVSEWSDVLGIKHRTIMSRLNLGWSVEDALGTPVRPTKPYKARNQEPS